MSDVRYRGRYGAVEGGGETAARGGAAAGDSSANLIASWILWILIGIFALLAMIFAILVWTRAGGIYTEVDAIDSCCSAVSTTVDEIDSTTIDTLYGVEELFFLECTPIFGQGPITEPGCYVFAEQITCEGSGISCIPIESDDVYVDMRGFGLDAPADCGGFSFYGYDNLRIANGRISTETPSNSLTSVAVDVQGSANVWLDGVVVENFYRPINDIFSDGLSVTSCTIEGANQINFDDFNNCVIYILGSNNTYVGKSKFRNNNVRGVVPQDYRQYASHGISSSSVDGAPSIGLVVEDTQLIDTRIRQTAFSFSAQISDIRISDCETTVTDPLYDASAIEIGDTDTVWNGTNTVDLGVVPITSVTIDHVTVTNLNPHPAYDPILVKMCTGLQITRCTISGAGNAFDPANGNIVSAMIHLGIGNSGIDYGEIDPFGVQNALIQDNLLVGRTNVTDPSNNRSAVGVLVEAYSSSIWIYDNKISGIAAGMPANPESNWCIDPDHNDDCDSIGQCALGPFPAQQTAGIRVNAGATGVHIEGNSLWDGSCANGNFTVLPIGIAVAAAELRASFCDTGVNVSFPAASQVVVKDNTVWNFCGKGISNLGTETMILDNFAFHNGASIADNYEDTGSPTTITVIFGAATLAGANLKAA